MPLPSVKNLSVIFCPLSIRGQYLPALVLHLTGLRLDDSSLKQGQSLHLNASKDTLLHSPTLSQHQKSARLNHDRLLVTRQTE